MNHPTKAPPSKVTKFAELGGNEADVEAPKRFVASTESVDRYGDVVRASGWQLDAFKRNPVALFGHNHSEIIGKISRVWAESKNLMADFVVAEAGTSQTVDYVRALLRQKLIRAVSVSFLPIEYDYLLDDRKQPVGYDFKKHELLVISLVSVPANGEALSIAKSMNLSEATRSALLIPANGNATRAKLRAELELLRVRGTYSNRIKRQANADR